MSERVRTETAAPISDAKRNKGRLPATVSKRRVLNVVHYPIAGGPHNRIARLAAPLAKRGWETIALIPKETGNAAQRLRAGGVEFEQLRLHRLRGVVSLSAHVAWASAFWPEVLAVKNLIQCKAVDLVVVCGLANSQSAIAARLAGVPVVWQITDSRAPRAFRVTMMRLLRRFADSAMPNGKSLPRLLKTETSQQTVFCSFPRAN